MPLDGCRYCWLITKHDHFQRWAPQPIGWHTWTPLEQPQIKARMFARRAARLAAEPVKYHATTAWAPDATGESGEPYCADCKTDGCCRWLRIQDRLDRQRWGIPGKTRARSSGWGGDAPW
ncbi:hypothetical protein ACIRLA_22010 [Streptomyces sp. NPDC102364]|uniref:hypothetical protein n=1 Tax=Streptomyces sp. NPDC102364 TaxID=3366161 RepID=UPI00381CF3EE